LPHGSSPKRPIAARPQKTSPAELISGLSAGAAPAERKLGLIGASDRGDISARAEGVLHADFGR
jgi:hypothetical protein